MGLCTWIYKNTGIKLRNFDTHTNQAQTQHEEALIAVQNKFAQYETQLQGNLINYDALLQEIRELKAVVSNLTITATVDNLALDLQSTERWRYPNLLHKVNEAEIQECADLIHKHLANSYLAPGRYEIRQYCLNRMPAQGMILEFGVFIGRSINHIGKYLLETSDQRIVHGFDSFEGLPTDGLGWDWEKGLFNLDGNMPQVESSVLLHKGWIEDTLPPFLEEHKNEKIAFLHIDTDIYEPAKLVLTACKDRLVPGSIILFDELIGFAGWRFHEYKALYEVFDESEFEYIAFSDAHQAAIRIK